MRLRRRGTSARDRFEVDGDLSAALDDAPVMVRTTAPDATTCTWCNRAWLAFRGRPLVEELGAGWAEGIHPDDERRVRDGYRRAVEERAAYGTEYAVRRVDGQYRTVAERGHPRFGPDGELLGFLVSAHDVTDQRTVRADLEQRTRQRAAIADLGRAALTGRDFRDLAADAARLVTDALALDSAMVLEMTPEHDLRVVASRGPRRTRLTRSGSDEELLGLARDTIVLAEPIVIDDWVEHRRSESGEPEGTRKIRSSSCAPIRNEHGSVGVLSAHSSRPGDFTNDDVNFLRNVANILGAALARQRVEHELRTSETHLRLALEAGRMGTWEWQPESDNVRWSPELSLLFGVVPGSFPGSFAAYIEHVHPEDRELVVKTIRTAVHNDTQIEMEHRVVLPDGTIRWVEGRGSRVADLQNARWIGVAIDVHERKAVEQERERLLELEQHTRRTLEETVARLDTLLEHSPFAFAFFDNELRFVRVNGRFSAMDGLPIPQHLGKPIADVLPDLWDQVRATFEHVIATQESVVDVEVSGWVPGTKWFERHYLVSCYPVRPASGDVLGLGAVFVDLTVRKRQETAALLIARASELFARTSDLDATLEEAVQIVIPEFADSCQLYLFETASAEPRVAVGHASEETRSLLQDAERRWPLDLTASRAAVADGSAVRLAEVPSDMHRRFAQNEEHLRLIEEHGATSAIVAPLETRGEVIGLLVLNYTPLSGRRYRHSDLGLAEELARRLAQVIEAARLEAEALRSQEQLDVLARAGELIAVELNVDARMRRFVRDVVPNFADVCVLHLRDDEGGFELEEFAVADSDLAEPFRAIDRWNDLPPGLQTPNREACDTGEPVLIPDVRRDRTHHFATPGIGAGVLSILCAPLIDENGDAFGTISFMYAWSERRYGDNDVPIANELARRAAASFRHAERFERERATAETLQRSLLPQHVPSVPGVATAVRYLPGESERVGGDWYDVFAMPDGNVLFAIGDVVGHGLQAASSTGLLRSAAQLAALDRLRPRAILEQLNRWLITLPDADMATVAVAMYDPRSRVFRFASAGHPPTLRMRRTGKARYLSGALGPPLRADATTKYRERSIRLREGDVLVFYTDGLIERRAESIDVGLSRLRDALTSAPEDLELLSDHVLEHTLPESGPADDVALMAIRVTKVGPLEREPRPRARPRHPRRRRGVRGWWARRRARS
ncbi:MAG: SpoIIE family protein phosphatase [Acidimicrobiia bacterium]